MKFGEQSGDTMPQPPGHPMPLHGVSDGFAHNQTHPRAGSSPAVGHDDVEHQIRLAHSGTPFDGVPEFCRPGHPVLSWEHGPRLPGSDQAVEGGGLCSAGRTRWRVRTSTHPKPKTVLGTTTSSAKVALAAAVRSSLPPWQPTTYAGDDRFRPR